MLPPPLAPPLPTPPVRRPRRPVPWLALLGVALVLGAIVGAIAWFGAFSPYGFVRFSAPPADRSITISRPGDYLVFEEGAGATDRELPPPLAITVLDERGRNVPVHDLIAPGIRGAPFAYHVPPNEGRAIARFTARQKGRYWLQIDGIPTQGVDPSDYSVLQRSGFAVGRELRVAWLRTPLGLLVLAGVPLTAGIVVLATARRRTTRRQSAKPPPSPAGAVL